MLTTGFEHERLAAARPRDHPAQQFASSARPERGMCPQLARCRTHHSWKWIARFRPGPRGVVDDDVVLDAVVRPALSLRLTPAASGGGPWSRRRAGSRRGASACGRGAWRCRGRRGRTRDSSAP